MLTSRKTLTTTERRVLDLLLAGDDPVLHLLRQQAETVGTVYRYRLGGASLASGPDMVVSLAPDTRKRSVSVASRARRLPGFADLCIEVGRCTALPSVSLQNGFISHLTLKQHRGTVPNALRGGLEDYGYKECEHWDEFCEHLAHVGVHARSALDIARRYPPRPPDAPRAPSWLRDVEDRVDTREPATPLALEALRAAAAAPLPDDLFTLLAWTDGVDTPEVSILPAREMHLVDAGTAGERLLVIGTDPLGDVYVLDLDHCDAEGDCPVLHLTHDPVGRRRVAPRVRPWLTSVLRP